MSVGVGSASLSEAELNYLCGNLHILSKIEQEEVLTIVEELGRRRAAERCRNDLIAFCQYMQTDYQVGRHHKVLGNLLMEIAEGKKTVFASISPLGTAKVSLFPSIFQHGS